MTVPVRTYPQGVPCWVDVAADDADAAQEFYAGLFGWTFERVTPPQAPPYSIASLDGADAAGLGAGPAEWSTYVAVDDVDASAATVRAAGGAVTEEPADAGEAGRSASCTDPAGTPFRLWRPGHREGVQVVNAPGAWNFSNLHADDPQLPFYERVFGWRVFDAAGPTMLQVPGYGEHLRTTVDPGIMERQAKAPAGFEDVVAGVGGPDADGASRWNVVFTVADRDASAARVDELGGEVLARADEAWSRTALLRDPQGAVFTVSQFSPPPGY